MNYVEVNFDGLIGPTHNYAGLAHGNVASAANAGSVSRPRQAALEGLQKMKFLHDLGIKQAILPPHPRPHLKALRALGFGGSVAEMIRDAERDAPVLFHHCYSASAMWTANAATIAPSADTKDKKLHLTPANLTSSLHRSLEAAFTAQSLKAIFADPTHFTHHAPLPATQTLSDEGAANHSRFCLSHGAQGRHLFVYGRSGLESKLSGTRTYLARQTFEASQTVARGHQQRDAIFVQQHPDAIDAGVFHNDVIAVANENVLLYHEQAFADAPALLQTLRASFGNHPFHAIGVSATELSVQDAVKTYLFNSQIVSLPGGGMAVIAPMESRDHAKTRAWLDKIKNDGNNPIRDVHYLDVRESMKNGGGPACLRLRVVMSEKELSRAHAGVFYSEALHERLGNWVNRHYREELPIENLADPRLADESFAALRELETILQLPGLYKEWIA